MRLKQLRIRNFRLLKRCALDFTIDSPITVLVGPNNSGKTSLTDALRILTSERSSIRDRLSVHDFSINCRAQFFYAEKRLRKVEETREEAVEALQKMLPAMRFSLTIGYDDTPSDFNLIRPYLMDLSPETSEVIVQMDFHIKNAANLATDFKERRNADVTLYDLLSEKLHDYYGFTMSKLSPDGRTVHRLDEGNKLSSLVRADSIPAQRYVDDHETSQSAKLSQLLHLHYDTYFRKTEPDEFEQVEEAIRSSAKDLTVRYERAFNRLIERLKEFGYPQGNNKPDMRIRAEMDSRTLYRDNTRVVYAAPTKEGTTDREYELPERYNGLGYKNLIYIVLKLESFRAALESDPENAPGIHLVSIEEPEVHLHPQMQSIFINEISKVLEETGGPTGQIIITTHSPHVVADSGFLPIRYFQRSAASVDVKDLSKLGGVIRGDNKLNDEEVSSILKFLRRYIKLAHCDLLFADKAILVEGQVEKLLMPAMVEQLSQEEGLGSLGSQYITILEVGGAYAHKLEPLLKFIGIPTLMITDIDSADKNGKKCRVSDGVSSTNAAIRHWLPTKKSIKELLATKATEKSFGRLRVAFQIKENGDVGRSFEEAFIYANLKWFEENASDLTASKKEVESAVANGLRASAYEFGNKIAKVDFALDLMTTPGWKVPKYIREGLEWLAMESRQ